MVAFTFALLVILTASSVSAGPVPIDNATLLFNGQQALLLNCQFQSLQLSDSCITGETACIQGDAATCVNGAWQTLPCPSHKVCFALPQVRTNGTFIACTSENNAASIINATGVQTGISSDCTSLGNNTLPFSTPNNTGPGDGGNNCTQGYGTLSPSIQAVTPTATDTPLALTLPPTTTTLSPGEVVPAMATQPALTLPPTTTTLTPEQASPLISLLSSSPTVPSIVSDSANNLAGSGSPVILLTSSPILSPAPTPTSAPASAGIPSNAGYSK